MKQHYLAFVLRVLSLPISATAQLVANDDIIYANSANGTNTNLLQNDTYNGGSAAQWVMATLLNSPPPGILLTGNTLNVAGSTPEGIYTLEYQVCLSGNPSVCDIALITVKVCYSGI